MSESRRTLLTGTGPFTREWFTSNFWILCGIGAKIFCCRPDTNTAEIQAISIPACLNGNIRVS